MPSPEVISLTKEAIPQFVQQIVDNLAPIGFPTEASQNLEDFLTTLYSRPFVSAIALVNEPQFIPCPLLRIYALHPQLIKDTKDYNIENNQIADAHSSKLVQPLERITYLLEEDIDIPYYQSFLHIVSPSAYPSPEMLQNRLVKEYGAGSSAGVIAVATFTRT